MIRISPLNYAFAVGKIRARERFLVRQEVFAQAIEARLEEALRLFVESGLYPEGLLYIQDSEDLERILREELSAVKKLIQNLVLEKELTSWLEIDQPKEIKESLKDYPSQFLNDYISYLIDLDNIKTFLRLYILKEPIDLLKASLTAQGFILIKDLLKLYPQELRFFLHHLEYVHKANGLVDYARFLREPIEVLVRDRSFVALEKAVSDFLIQVLKPAKYFVFGPEPLLAYYLAKKNEIDLVRLVVLAKLNNVSADLVKKRLNRVYA